jgi:xanthine/CO dehydrogenase XdhC/CoxF family maturation factor
MEEDAEVVAVDAEVAADLVSVALVEEDGLEQGAVSGCDVEEDGANLVLDLVCDGEVEGASSA